MGYYFAFLYYIISMMIDVCSYLVEVVVDWKCLEDHLNRADIL